MLSCLIGAKTPLMGGTLRWYVLSLIAAVCLIAIVVFSLTWRREKRRIKESDGPVRTARNENNFLIQDRTPLIKRCAEYGEIL